MLMLPGSPPSSLLSQTYKGNAALIIDYIPPPSLSPPSKHTHMHSTLCLSASLSHHVHHHYGAMLNTEKITPLFQTSPIRSLSKK